MLEAHLSVSLVRSSGSEVLEVRHLILSEGSLVESFIERLGLGGNFLLILDLGLDGLLNNFHSRRAGGLVEVALDELELGIVERLLGGLELIVDGLLQLRSSVSHGK